MSDFKARAPVSLLTLFTGAALLAGCEGLDTTTGPAVDGSVSEGHHQAVVMDPGLRGELAGVRRATAGYQNVRSALADGYTQFSVHVPNMGIHYLHGSAINADATPNLDRSLDRTDPEILVYVNDGSGSEQQRLVAVEYAIPKEEDHPPAGALDLFSGLEPHDWHVHPSRHDLGLPSGWTVHGECHYQGGLGVFLAEDPGGNHVLLTPDGPAGGWSGTVEPAQCPTALGGEPLPPLLLAHGKWWTLHAWAWFDNPRGVFHPTNPRVPMSG